VTHWATGLEGATTRCPAPTRRLLLQHHHWTQPALLRLPRDYDRLFTVRSFAFERNTLLTRIIFLQYYHERICSQCGAVPKEASVCLLCGTVICLKQQCCRHQDVCEAVSVCFVRDARFRNVRDVCDLLQHSIDCGGGTGIFLVVTSTYIIIVRGRRACLWGSLYLDDYDEEDRDLKYAFLRASLIFDDD
jgi:E3 ubiquitin-protein ligase UBR3